jgi:FkbM family methyltransferase
MKSSNIIIEKSLKMVSKVVRNFPLNAKKGIFIKWSLLLRRCHFDYTFRLENLGIIWSSNAFPDILTRTLMFKGSYQEDVLVAIQKLCREGDIFYDVGAHHGLMSIVASKAVGNGGKVIAFEPNPDALRHLYYHLKLNNAANVIVEPIGLMDREGYMDFYQQKGAVTWNSSFIKQFVGRNSPINPINIQTTTLDKFVADTGLIPNVIKIDCEGSEMPVLKGGPETIKKYRPIIIIELNLESASAAGVSVMDFVKFFKERSYGMYVLEKNFWGNYNVDKKRKFDEIKIHSKDITNVICVPAEKVSDMG